MLKIILVLKFSVTLPIPSQSSGIQFFILGLLFLFLEWIAIAVYAYIGTHIQTKFKALMGQAGQMMFNRICALLLGAAGIALLLA